MLGRPWATRTVSSGSRLCSMAHLLHTRATAGVESTRTPSRSNRSPSQESSTIINDNRRYASELDVTRPVAPADVLAGCGVAVLKQPDSAAIREQSLNCVLLADFSVPTETVSVS